MKFSLKYENDIEGKGASDGLSQGKPTFEVETEGALEDAHGGALVNVRVFTKQFNKNELEEECYVALEGAPKISF